MAFDNDKGSYEPSDDESSSRELKDEKLLHLGTGTFI